MKTVQSILVLALFAITNFSFGQKQYPQDSLYQAMVKELRRIAPMNNCKCEIWWYANDLIGNRAIVGKCKDFKPGNYWFPTDLMELDTTYSSPSINPNLLSSLKKTTKLSKKELREYRKQKYSLYIAPSDAMTKIMKLNIKELNKLNKEYIAPFDRENPYWLGLPENDTVEILQPAYQELLAKKLVEKALNYGAEVIEWHGEKTIGIFYENWDARQKVIIIDSDVYPTGVYNYINQKFIDPYPLFEENLESFEVIDGNIGLIDNSDQPIMYQNSKKSKLKIKLKNKLLIRKT